MFNDYEMMPIVVYTSGVFVSASQRYHVESFRKAGAGCDGTSFSAF